MSSAGKHTVSRIQEDGRASSKLIACPFEVRVDDTLVDHFYDVRDALAFARASKASQRKSRVVVMDARTGKLMIEVDG